MIRMEEIRNTAEDYLYGGIINSVFDDFISEEYVKENRDQILQDCYEYCISHRTVRHGIWTSTAETDNRHAKFAGKQAIINIADEILRSEGL